MTFNIAKTMTINRRMNENYRYYLEEREMERLEFGLLWKKVLEFSLVYWKLGGNCFNLIISKQRNKTQKKKTYKLFSK